MTAFATDAEINEAIATLRTGIGEAVAGLMRTSLDIPVTMPPEIRKRITFMMAELYVEHAIRVLLDRHPCDGGPAEVRRLMATGIVKASVVEEIAVKQAIVGGEAVH